MTPTLTEMNEHVHDIEYGQEPGDFEKNAWQMRCRGCGYQSYMLTKPPAELLEQAA